MDRFFALAKVKFDEFEQPVFTKKTHVGSSASTLSGIKGFYDCDTAIDHRDIFEYHGYFDRGIWYPAEGAEEAAPAPPATPPAGPVTLFDAFNPSTEVAERSGRLWLKGEGGEALIGFLLGHRACKSAKDVADAIYKAMGLTPPSAEPVAPAEPEFPKPVEGAGYDYVITKADMSHSFKERYGYPPNHRTIDDAIATASRFADDEEVAMTVYQAVAVVHPNPVVPEPDRIVVRADKKAA